MIAERIVSLAGPLITEAWTGQNLSLVDQTVSAEYFEHTPFGDVEGREGSTDGINMFVGAFSPVRLEVHDLIGC